MPYEITQCYTVNVSACLSDVIREKPPKHFTISRQYSEISSQEFTRFVSDIEMSFS